MLTREQIQERRTKIVLWLTSDSMEDHRRDFRNGNGFSVGERDRVEMNGQVLSMTEYLKKEGFGDNMVIGEYRVTFNQATDQFPENFSFFLMSPVKDVPNFDPNGNRQQDILGWLKSDGMEDAVRIFRDGVSFSTNDRVRVNAYGNQMPITEWLKSEDFADGQRIGEYQVRYNPPKGDYPENFSFFALAPVVQVPQF